MKRELLLLSPILFVACDVDHSLGNADLDASGQDGSQSVADASTPSTTDPQTSGTTGAAQSWTGYVENYQFGSGSDRIKLVFTADANGQIAGTVTFGNGIAPPPATDPDVGYPPGLNGTTTMPGEYLEGPAFTIKSGSLQSNRLRFTIDPIELWTGWCALQTPVDGSSICVPNWGGSSNATHTDCKLVDPSGAEVPIDCVKWDLCLMSMICLCSPTGCVVNSEDSGYKTSFDVFLANGTASGSMSGNVFGDHNVHFTRD
jgi:hypothetical protein